MRGLLGDAGGELLLRHAHVLDLGEDELGGLAERHGALPERDDALGEAGCVVHMRVE